MTQSYGNDSIKQLKGAQRVRQTVNATLGSRGLDGAKQTVIEIVGNATDEKLAGFDNGGLDIGLYDDNSISVRDYGRGVPLGWNEREQNWNYFLIYEELYAGGKYDNNQNILRDIESKNAWDSFRMEDHPYLITIGLNGLGAAATQFTSEYFEVISRRGGKASRMLYKEGAHVLPDLEVTDTNEPDGTFVHWKPSGEVFTETNIPSKWLDKVCYSLSYISGFDVRFNNKGNIKEYPKKSMKDVMIEGTGFAAEKSNFLHTVDNEDDVCICQADVVIGPAGMGKEYYHNRVAVVGGAHSSGYFCALSDFFNDISKNVGIKIKESDYSGKFSIIISTLANKMNPRGQTKDSVDDFYINNCIYECIYSLVREEYAKGTQWLMKIIDEVVTTAQNRIAVDEMSKNLRELERTTKRHKVSNKFHSCKSYDKGDVASTEFLIVEGDSAGGKVKVARDQNFQCYLSIRGKSLNVYKATIDKLLANKEIKDIIATLGCGVDLGIEGYASFDISKLKVGKIIFCADADIDGSHIVTLLFLIFWKLFPELLYTGHVYVAESPLFVINTLDNNPVYCMDMDELNEKMAEEKAKGNFHSFDRFKGLGETDAEDLWDTTLNPQTRRLRQIKIERGDMDVYEALEVLFGRSTDRRKRAILGGMMGADFDETIEEQESISDYIDSLDLNRVEVEEVEY